MSTILDREYVIKDGKYLKMTPLGDVVNGLMCDRFKDIVDVKFTAHMEEELDEVESGKLPWKQLLRVLRWLRVQSPSGGEGHGGCLSEGPRRGHRGEV